MTIRVSKDVERAIDAAVRDGRFASADEMVDWLVREYAGFIPRVRQPVLSSPTSVKTRPIPSGD